MLLLTTLGSTLIFSLPVVFANPVCGATLTANTTLTANIGPCSGNGLIIGANGITLDCAGHTISGTGTGNGITLSGLNKVTVKNCEVTGFGFGFYLQESSHNTLTKNTANSNVDQGFYLTITSNGNTLSENTANSNGYYGFELVFSSIKNTLTKNTANSNTHYGYYDTSFSSSASAPHWDTANSYKGDKGTGNGVGLAGGNPNIQTATSPF